MLQLQIIFQHYYKMLMWTTSYWFSSRFTINIIFSFTNNHLPQQQFVKWFVSLILFFNYIITFMDNKLIENEHFNCRQSKLLKKGNCQSRLSKCELLEERQLRQKAWIIFYIPVLFLFLVSCGIAFSI